MSSLNLNSALIAFLQHVYDEARIGTAIKSANGTFVKDIAGIIPHKYHGELYNIHVHVVLPEHCVTTNVNTSHEIISDIYYLIQNCLNYKSTDKLSFELVYKHYNRLNLKYVKVYVDHQDDVAFKYISDEFSYGSSDDNLEYFKIHKHISNAITSGTNTFAWTFCLDDVIFTQVFRFCALDAHADIFATIIKLYTEIKEFQWSVYNSHSV
jgi:hypothetical protein